MSEFFKKYLMNIWRETRFKNNEETPILELFFIPPTPLKKTPSTSVLGIQRSKPLHITNICVHVYPPLFLEPRDHPQRVGSRGWVLRSRDSDNLAVFWVPVQGVWSTKYAPRGSFGAFRSDCDVRVF